MTRARAALVLALALPATARANGRFPTANYLMLGPGARNDLVALRTTFGLVLSRDLGARWEWVCEEALDAVGGFDPSVALGSDGAIALGIPTGLRVSSPDGCAWSSPPGSAARVVDVTQDAAGAVLFAAAGPFAEGDSAYSLVLRSDDQGRAWRTAARIDDFFVETIDVAPGDARRVYASGYGRGAVTRVLRSDDGGARFRPTAARFPDLSSAYIAGVDPSRPDRLWLRVTEDLGTGLYRSDDGGEGVTRVASTAAPMTGFAVSDDGETVWYGAADRALGVHRATRGGAFARVGGPVSVRCMRFHAGVLFVCADEATDGYSLAWSRDGGERLNPWMSVRDIAGPLPGCAGDASVTAVCAAPWAQLAPTLGGLDAAAPPPRVPLSLTDAGADVPDVPAVDVPAVDVPAVDVAGAVPPRQGCACGVPTRPARCPWWLLALALARPRRRAR